MTTLYSNALKKGGVLKERDPAAQNTGGVYGGRRTTSYIDDLGKKKTGVTSLYDGQDTQPEVKASLGYDRDTDYAGLINAEKAKGDGANQQLLQALESARNAKIYGEGMNYDQTQSYGGTFYSDIAKSTDTNYLSSLLQKLQSQYDSALASSDSAYAAQIEQARAAVQNQINALTEQYGATNKQLYRDYMESRKNTPQQLSAMGYTGGLTESSLLGLDTAYGEALNENERSRLSDIRELQSGLNQNELEAQIAKAQARQQLGNDYYSNYAGLIAQLQSQKNYEEEQEAAREETARENQLYLAELLASQGNYSGYAGLYGDEYAKLLQAGNGGTVQGSLTPAKGNNDATYMEYGEKVAAAARGGNYEDIRLGLTSAVDAGELTEAQARQLYANSLTSRRAR